MLRLVWMTTCGRLTARWRNDEVPAAYRCSTCSIDWPALLDYGQCPQCGHRTWRNSEGDPLDSDEARKLVGEIQFEKYYQDREAKRAAEFAEEMTARIGPLEA